MGTLEKHPSSTPQRQGDREKKTPLPPTPCFEEVFAFLPPDARPEGGFRLRKVGHKQLGVSAESCFTGTRGL